MKNPDLPYSIFQLKPDTDSREIKERLSTCINQMKLLSLFVTASPDILVGWDKEVVDTYGQLMLDLSDQAAFLVDNI